MWPVLRPAAVLSYGRVSQGLPPHRRGQERRQALTRHRPGAGIPRASDCISGPQQATRGRAVPHAKTLKHKWVFQGLPPHRRGQERRQALTRHRPGAGIPRDRPGATGCVPGPQKASRGRAAHHVSSASGRFLFPLLTELLQPVVWGNSVFYSCRSVLPRR